MNPPRGDLASNLGIRRAHEPPDAGDGCRVLVDRLWPRGLRREQVAVDLWLKDVAPSTALRKWFAHDPDKWAEFVDRYRAELDANPQALRRLEALLRAHGRLTLVYAALDPVHNHAAALREYLRQPAGGADASAAPGPQLEGLRERLEGEHARLLSLIDDARLALLRGDAQGAREVLEAMATLHAAHAHLEEARLFPSLPRAARWPRRTYEAEHEALAQALDALRQRLRDLPARIRPARQRLELIDAALPLRHLLEHHFEREEKGLFEDLGLSPGAPARPASR